MKSKNLKEYFGTQRPSFAGGPGAGSNFYSGADLGAHTKGRLGTRGADSKFSQRMQAIVPNDYYDLLEEDDEEIDEDYVVENSRYSLKELDLFEVKRDKRPKLTPNEDKFWTDAITKSLNSISNESTKGRIKALISSAQSKRSKDDTTSSQDYWISFILYLYKSELNTPINKNQFNNSLKNSLNDDKLMKKIIFNYVKYSDTQVTVGRDSDFPAVDFDDYLNQQTLDDRTIETFLRKNDFASDLKNLIEKQLEPNKEVFQKIFLTSKNKTLYEFFTVQFFNHFSRQINVYKNSNRSKAVDNKDARKEEASPKDETLDLDLPVENLEEPKIDSVSISPETNVEPVIDRVSTAPATNPKLKTSTESDKVKKTDSSDRASEKENFFDQVFEDPMFDNPFVKLFVKRPGDRQVGLQDFYRYYKDERKKNESFELSLKNRSLAYLVQETVMDDLTNIGTDILGDLGASAASAGTFGITSAVFIVKNLYELQETSKKADIAIEAFLLNPSDKTCEKIEKILSDIITDFIDLVQRIVEVIPEPTGELATLLSSGTINFVKILKSLKDFFSVGNTLEKIKNIGKMYLILKPFIKIILSILDSEQTPEEVKNDKRFILGTLNKMVLIIDLTEDYYIQKKAAETAGIKDFQYQYKIIKLNDSFDDYDPETSRARISPSQREREYASEQYDIFDFLQDSLKRKSLSYLISESEENVDEEVEAEGEELEEFSGVGAVAGFTLPLGASPRGPKGAHSSTTGGKAYPYSSSDRSKFNKFSKKTFGGK